MMQEAESCIEVFHCATSSTARCLYLNLCWRLNLPVENLKSTHVPKRYEGFEDLGVLVCQKNAHLTRPELCDHGLATFLRESAACLTEPESFNISTLLTTLISESSQPSNEVKILNNLEVYSFLLGLLKDCSNFSEEALFDFSFQFSAPLFAFVNELLQIFFMKDSARARIEIIKDHGTIDLDDNSHFIYLGAFSDIGDSAGSDCIARGTDICRLKNMTAEISCCDSVLPSKQPVFTKKRVLVATLITPSSFEEKLRTAKNFCTYAVKLVDFTCGDDPFAEDASRQSAELLCNLRASSFTASVASDPVCLERETERIQAMSQCVKKLKKLQGKRRRSESSIHALELVADELKKLKENL